MRSASVRDHTAQMIVSGLSTRRCGVSRFSLLVLIIGLGAMALPSAARAEGLSPMWGSAADLMDDEDKWIKEFMEVLRRLYAALGGDPSKLGNSPSMAMTNVTFRVLYDGIPSNLTPEQTSAMLTDIESLIGMLEDPPSSVSPGTFPEVLSLLLSLLS